MSLYLQEGCTDEMCSTAPEYMEEPKEDEGVDRMSYSPVCWQRWCSACTFKECECECHLRGLYLKSPGIHAAVHRVADIAARGRSKDELFEDLIKFFGQYDRERTDQIESLTHRLTEALKGGR